MTPRYTDRPTYSQRHGRGPRSATLTFEDLRSYMVSVVNDLFAQAYLQEAFGYDCVDRGTVPGALGRDPDLYFIRRLGFAVMPISKTVQGMDPDQLFDFLEALHDVVSMGNELTGYYHEFSRCGWHFRDFDRRYGQDHLETVVNPLLARLETPLVLTPEGQLEELTAPDMQSLLDTPLTDVVRLTDRQRVDAAVNRFKRSRGNSAERRAAVQELAAVLEFLRPQVKEAMLSKDEAALFSLANGFSIRHNNREQREDYDPATWLPWAFYVYLATIQAVGQVIERQNAGGS